MNWRFLKEPLLHFLLIGAALFGAYALVNRGSNEVAAPQVRLTEADVGWLKDTFRAQYQRDPSADELTGLLRDFVKEALFAREAQALGLDKDDIVVRRRLAQKMTFLVQDNSPSTAPSDDDLHRLYEAQRGHAPVNEGGPGQTGPQALFTRPRVSFTQVYFDRDRRADAAADARTALQQLSQGKASASAAEIGDQGPLKTEIRNADERTVANQFGTKFAAEIFALAPGPWAGPIESVRGVHLVHITTLMPAELKPFDEVRDQLVEMWRAQVQRENEEKTFVSLLQKYQLVPDENVKALAAPLLDEAAGANQVKGGKP